MKNSYHFTTPIGIICIEENGQAVTALYRDKNFDESKKKGSLTPLLKKAGEQLTEYLKGERKEFSLPLAPEGTEFQKKIWQELCRIPYGETRTYGEIARQAGNPKACRAVGGANNRNPIMIFIPCHRVIGADGSLTGYGGGLEVKEYLLKLEKSR